MTEQQSDDLFEVVALALCSAAWRWRTELLFLCGTGLSWYWLSKPMGRIPAGIFVGLVVAGIVVLPTIRHPFARALFISRHRRRFLVAVANLRTSVFTDRPPRVRRIERVPAGVRLHLVLTRGTHAGDLENAAPVLAAALGVREVRVACDAANASRVAMTIVATDSLAGPPRPWPWATRGQTNAWAPVPVGVDEDGIPVTISLPEHNVLLGGEPGAGKSGALSQIVAAAALDPSVSLWLLDGKLVELAPWQPCARCFVGPDVGQATEVLCELRAEMDRRYEHLFANGKRKVEAGRGFGLHVVVCDELFLFTAHPDKKLAAAFCEALRDLVARGRAAGIVVVAATQKPSTEVVPSALRDLFGFRWALRCTTREASDTVLGAGWSSLGFSSADIDPKNRGAGLLLYEGGEPVRLRSYWLDDETIGDLADRAARLRRSEGGEGEW